jgi:hypothetical protein
VNAIWVWANSIPDFFREKLGYLFVKICSPFPGEIRGLYFHGHVVSMEMVTSSQEPLTGHEVHQYNWSSFFEEAGI